METTLEELQNRIDRSVGFAVLLADALEMFGFGMTPVTIQAVDENDVPTDGTTQEVPLIVIALSLIAELTGADVEEDESGLEVPDNVIEIVQRVDRSRDAS